MPVALRSIVFIAGVGVSLGAGWVLVQRLERVGQRFGFSEALLGLVAALAADAPEITAAVTALINHDRRIGAGVVLGSNAFNLAALLGLSALVAGSIVLHRRVVLMNGAVAVWTAALCLLTVTGALPIFAALALELLVFVPYVVLLSVGTSRLTRIPAFNSSAEWLAHAIGEEEIELEDAIHPPRGVPRDALVAVVALLVVVGASIAMEQEASALGNDWSVAPIIVGALVLAAVTSTPEHGRRHLSRRARARSRDAQHRAQQQPPQRPGWPPDPSKHPRPRLPVLADHARRKRLRRPHRSRPRDGICRSRAAPHRGRGDHPRLRRLRRAHSWRSHNAKHAPLRYRLYKRRAPALALVAPTGLTGWSRMCG